MRVQVHLVWGWEPMLYCIWCEHENRCCEHENRCYSVSDSENSDFGQSLKKSHCSFLDKWLCRKTILFQRYTDLRIPSTLLPNEIPNLFSRLTCQILGTKIKGESILWHQVYHSYKCLRLQNFMFLYAYTCKRTVTRTLTNPDARHSPPQPSHHLH